MAKENVKEYGAFSQYMLLREATKDIKRDKKEENEESIVSITSLVPEMNSDGLNLDVSKIHRGKVPSAGSPWLVRPDRNSDSSIQIVLRFIDEKSNTSLTEFGNNRGYMLRWLSPLKDQLLVDLGAGVSADGYRFAMIAGARGYIGIEAFFADRLMARVKQEIFTAGTEGQRCIPASIISEDMLHALQRFPPHSVSVLASAIDNFLMWDDPAYLKKVGNEASRILHPKGTFITFASDITPIELMAERSRIVPALSKHSLFLQQG